MSRAFVKEPDGDLDQDDEPDETPAPAGPQYITAAGFAQLQAEFQALWRVERPKVAREVEAAAALGDRSENAEYIYGKRRLREIDRRLRFLTKRLESAEVVKPGTVGGDQVRFGAYVTLADEEGKETVYRIVGADE